MSKETTTEKTPQSRRYRKIAVRMWGDEKFNALSALPPCGQGLWLYLLTGPHTSNIPGLFRVGRAALAEELDWELEDFDKAFQEALDQGMVKADWKAKVVWIPNAVSYNLPESPNVVASWGAAWDLIPECDLKREAFEVLKASIHAVSEAYGKSFDKAFSKPSAKPSRKTIGNQEQEQEQEQEQDKTNPPQPPVAGGCPGTLTEKKARVKSERMTLKTFLDRCRTSGERPIGGYEPLQTYIAEAKLPVEFVNLAWAEFKRDFGPGGKRERKQQALWRRHFQNFVEGNFYRLWYAKPQGDGIAYELTTVGLQAQMATQTREAA